MKAHELLTTASPHDAREEPCTFLHARSPSSLHLPSLDHRSINSTQSSSLRSHTPFIPAVAAGYFKQRKRLTVTFSIALRIIYNLRQIFATRPQMTERHLRLWPGAGTAQSLSQTLGTDIGCQQHRVFPGHSPATVISSHRLMSAEFPGNLGGRQKPVLMNDRPSSHPQTTAVKSSFARSQSFSVFTDRVSCSMIATFNVFKYSSLIVLLPRNN